jgi:hypothetical protein
MDPGSPLRCGRDDDHVVFDAAVRVIAARDRLPPPCQVTADAALTIGVEPPPAPHGSRLSASLRPG